LGVLFSGGFHYAALTNDRNMAVIVPDPHTGREARANDIRLGARQVWVGSAAWRAELAAVPGVSYQFCARDLADFGCAVATDEGLVLSSESALALLLRKAIFDSRHVGLRVSRLVVSLDLDDSLPTSRLRRLEQFFTEVVALRVRVMPTHGAIESFLHRRVGHLGSAGLLAMLQDQVWVGKMAAGTITAARIPSHASLSPLRNAFMETGKGAGGVPAWSKHRVWQEFVTWHSGLARGPDAAEAAFCPYQIDRRFRRQAFTPRVAQSALRAAFATAVAGALGGMADLPAGSDLWLLGDDALELGLRDAIEPPRRQTGMTVKAQGLARVAMAMAEMQTGQVDERHSVASHGVLVRSAHDSPKELKTLVMKGDELPAAGEMTLSGLRGEQRRFKIDVAAQHEGHPPVVLRHVYFEPKQGGAVTGLNLTLQMDDMHRLLVNALDQRTREPLLLVDSSIPCRDGTLLSGPESLARLVMVGSAS
jgi:hypothetical protein